jgi:hypothetical protein
VWVQQDGAWCEMQRRVFKIQNCVIAKNENSEMAQRIFGTNVLRDRKNSESKIRNDCNAKALLSHKPRGMALAYSRFVISESQGDVQVIYKQLYSPTNGAEHLSVFFRTALF